MSAISLQSILGAENAIQSLGNAQQRLAASGQRLSSGNRLTSAADDVVALSVGARYQTQIGALKQQQSTIARSSSLLQQVDGSLGVVGNILQRMHALSLTASSTTLTHADRSFIELEFQGLASQIDSIASSTSFNGIPLLNGGSEGVYLLDQSTLERSANNGLLADSRAARADDLSVKQLLLFDGESTIDLQAHNLSGNELSALDDTLKNNRNARVQITIDGLNGVVGNDLALHERSLTVDITTQLDALGYSAGDLSSLDYSQLQELALSGLKGQYGDQGLIFSGRSLLQLTPALGDQQGIVYSVANASTDALFHHDAPSIASAQQAQDAQQSIIDAIHYITGERVRTASASELLDLEAQTVSTKIAHFDDIRSSLQDTDIARESTTYAIEQVLLQASLSTLAQTQGLHKTVVEKLLSPEF